MGEDVVCFILLNFGVDGNCIFGLGGIFFDWYIVVILCIVFGIFVLVI